MMNMRVLDLKENNLLLLTFQLNNFTFRIFFFKIILNVLETYLKVICRN